MLAETNPALGIFITNVLCSPKADDFSACESQYARGKFQAINGLGLTGVNIKAGGARIDPVTYKKR
ncbi:hypothetical protein [Actimicrobium sp. GrIS 1.19]|uniref:hypothetical protein n=1 Tax=Actimicrobium sp. GrIS 1.19 TaxID=3071708 RepID=UPI002E15E4BE